MFCAPNQIRFDSFRSPRWSTSNGKHGDTAFVSFLLFLPNKSKKMSRLPLPFYECVLDHIKIKASALYRRDNEHSCWVIYADLASPLCCAFIFFLNSSQGSQLISRVDASWTLHPHLLPHVHPTNLHRAFVQGSIGGSTLAACAFFAAWRLATSSSILWY